MSALPKVIEGTWEEILTHAPQLAGRLLQVTIVDDADNWKNHPGLDKSPEAVAAWVKRLKEWAYNRPMIRLGDDSRDAIYEDYLK